MIIAILEQALLTLPLILGAYLSISLMKLPDLSLESAYVFGATVAVASQTISLPFDNALFNTLSLFSAAMMGGMAVGATSSLLNQYYKLPFLLAAILTNGFYHGLIQFVLGTPVLSLSNKFNPLQSFSLSFLPNEFTILLLVALAVLSAMIFLLHSQLGCAFAIFGNNPHFFHHYGISQRYVVMSGVILANGLAGLGGFLFALSNRFVDLSMGFGLILLCLTALILGKTIVRAKRSIIIVPLVGILAYYALQQTLLSVGLNLKYFNAAQAFVVLLALVSLKIKTLNPSKTIVDHLGV